MIPNSYPTLNFNLGETAEMLRAQVAAFAADPRYSSMLRIAIAPRTAARDCIAARIAIAPPMP